MFVLLQNTLLKKKIQPIKPDTTNSPFHSVAPGHEQTFRCGHKAGGGTLEPQGYATQVCMGGGVL